RSFWGKRFYAQLAAQYDRHNLYIAAHFRSFGPMTNAMRQSTLQGYGGGDALQIRLSSGTKKVNLCGWYDSAAKRPALTADRGDLPNPFLLKQGAREAFAADADGRGYVQEIAVPWKLILGRVPRSSARIAATFQLWWADLTPRFSFYASTTLQRRGALVVDYKMPTDGDLTLGLFNKQGRLLRWLVQNEYRYAGPNRLFWNGLDQWGKPVPAGDYVFKAVYHPPITTDYLLSVCNPGHPPWPTPDNKGDWLSDEENPQAAVTDGKWVFLAAPGAELGYSIMAVDSHGQRQWGSRVAVGGRCVSLALAGRYVYAVYSDIAPVDHLWYSHHEAVGQAYLVCLNKRTGLPALFTRQSPRLKIAGWPYREDYHWLDVLRNHDSFTPATYGGQPRYFDRDVGESTNAIGLAAAGGKLYVSLLYNNKLLVLNAHTGKPTGSSINVNAPAGLYGLNAHKLLAVSGKTVVRVDLRTHAVTPLITSHLVAPDSVTVGPDGHIYVSDWGNSFQVKVFDSDGHFLRAIGKKGGRPWVGKWNPDGMLVPRGIAVTQAGKLWVAEDDGSPCRISVWNAHTGAFLRDYIGPTPYGGGTYFWIDPKNPTHVYTEGTLFKVNDAQETWKPKVIVFRRRNIDDPFTPDGHALADCQVRILYHGGHEYAFIWAGPAGPVVMQQQGDIYRPVAAFGGISGGFHNDGRGLDAPDSVGHHLYENYFPPFFKGRVGDLYSWTDLNGDNLVQAAEMHWVKPTKDGIGTWQGPYWGTDLSPDWKLYFLAQYHGHVEVFHLDCRGWTAAGAPIYNMADAKPFIAIRHGWNINSLHVTNDHKLIVAYDYERWSSAVNSVECYSTKTGRLLWAIARPKPYREPSRQQYRQVHTQGAIYDFNVPGVGDVFGTWSYHGACAPYLITSDGLYLGSFFKDTLLGPESLRGESALYYYQAPDGATYAINGANQAEHIFRLHGLESAKRFALSYHISPADVARAAAMRLVPVHHAPPQPLLAVQWRRKAPVINGNLSGWDMNSGVVLNGPDHKTAHIVLQRDATHLYLAYQVHEPTPPMTNKGGDWQTLFISGDCVDLMLQTNPRANPHRRVAVAGDERLLISVFQGKPIAVLYQPVAVNKGSPVRLGTTTIDRIIRLRQAQVAIRRDGAHGVYTVEAAIPLKELWINPQFNGNLRGDVGVIYADETGTSRSLRLYYYNHHTQRIDDLATEAALQPQYWGRINMPLGPNLLKDGEFSRPPVRAQRGKKAAGDWSYGASPGASVTTSTTMPYTGTQSLLLQARSGFLTVGQNVPVIPGHLYSLRYRARGVAFEAPHEDPGHPTTIMWSEIDWHVAPRGRTSIDYSGQMLKSQSTWQTFYNWRGFAVPSPYKAPAGATSATIVLGLKSHLKDHMARAYISDVEFVDVTPTAHAIHGGH
ncbi:MAG: hypothetical protein HKL95_01650, partial [Phycisphaerae bacterium]|nr:hypothetical protein [Phycisphaerae bacterium]